MYSFHKNSLYFILINLSIEKDTTQRYKKLPAKIMIYAGFEASSLLFMCINVFFSILTFTSHYKNVFLCANVFIWIAGREGWTGSSPARLCACWHDRSEGAGGPAAIRWGNRSDRAQTCGGDQYVNAYLSQWMAAHRVILLFLLFFVIFLLASYLFDRSKATYCH